MKIAEVLSKLYDKRIGNVISALNASVYAADCRIRQGENFVIHTGVSFCTQKDKTFELFYDFTSEKLIRQIRFDNTGTPQLLGLICSSEGKFIDLYSDSVVYKINADAETITIGEINGAFDPGSGFITLTPDGSDEKITIANIEVIIDGNVINFPFKKHLPRIFYDGKHFSRYVDFDEYVEQKRADEAQAERYWEDFSKQTEDFLDESGMSWDDLDRG